MKRKVRVDLLAMKLQRRNSVTVLESTSTSILLDKTTNCAV